MPAGPDPIEVWSLSLRNTGRRARQLSVFAYAELSLESSVGTYGHASYLNGLFLTTAANMVSAASTRATGTIR